jgi:uncharacterized protein
VNYVALRGWTRALAAALALLSTSCSILPAPRPNMTRYFVLTAIAPRASSQASNVSTADAKLKIGLGPINFPDYLARTEIVTRAAGNRVELSPTDRWVEPLDVTFKRILSHDLAIALGGAQVAAFPWFGSPAHFDYRVEPVIDRFEADPQGVARLTARWTVFDGANDRLLYASTTDLSVAATAANSAAMAAALSQAESEFAGEIAAAIRRLHAQAPSSQRESDRTGPADSR